MKKAGDLKALRDLQALPGVGPRIAEHLLSLGIRRPADLRTQDPEALYARFNRKIRKKADPCLLYVFRCAVYYASQTRHERRLLKWWNWKSRRVRAARPRA